jgi:hypothetical protein
MFDN